MKRYIRFMAAYALGAFALSALLPIWFAYYFGDREVTDEATWFPGMIDSLIVAAKRESTRTLFDFYWAEPVKLVAVLILGAAMGLYKARRTVGSKK